MAVDLLGPLIGFASGIAVSTTAAIVSSRVQRRAEQRKRREKATFQIYMMLLELNAQYFWIASNELHEQPSPKDLEHNVRDLAWRIADRLRENDDVPYLDDILTVLMSEDAYATANDRANALDQILGKLGDTANPRYARIIRHISSGNLLGFAKRPSGHRNNSPGNMGMP